MTLGVCPKCKRSIPLRGHVVVRDINGSIIFGRLGPHRSKPRGGHVCSGSGAVDFVKPGKP